MTLAVDTNVTESTREPVRSPMNDEDVEIERLLSQKLLEGYVLMERSCPTCSIPLVKKNDDSDDDLTGNNKENPNNLNMPIVVPSDSFDQPFRPVNGVPFCVQCQAHVVTDESEISILERCDSLKAKGQILVSLRSYPSNDGSTTQDQDTHDQQTQDEQTQDQSGATEEDLLQGVVSGGDKTQPVTNGYDATAFMCGSKTSRQMVVQTPEPHFSTLSGEQGLEVGNLMHHAEGQKSTPPEMHSDEKKDDDDHHVQRSEGTSPTPGTEEVTELEKTSGGIMGDIMEEYSVRREIATKVLGAKMLQGYTLKETQCEKCGMPLMEYNDKLECVVCPALAKKAKKKLKERQRLAEQKERMQREIDAAKAKRAKEEANALLRHQDEEDSRLREQEEDEAVQRQLDAEEKEDIQALEAEALALEMEMEEQARIAALEAEERRLLAEARARAEEEARIREDEEKAAAAAAAATRLREESLTDSSTLETSGLVPTETEVKLQKMKEEEQRRREEEDKLLEETKRLEKLEQDRAASKMRRDLLIQEERKLLAEKNERDAEIKRMEQVRQEELMEQKQQEEERRVLEEAELLGALEQEAAAKAKAAEEAIERAKAALATVSSARKDIIAQTIAMAEAEAVAEAEGIIKAEQENYKAPVVLPTKEELRREHWETLRQEGRSVMTRRLMAGWSLMAEFCLGSECENSPLLILGNKKECVVCGGCGNGRDGAYLLEKKEADAPARDEKEEVEEELQNVDDDVVATVLAAAGSKAPTVDTVRDVVTPTDEIMKFFAVEDKETDALVASPTANQSLQELQEDFEAKRNMVSKEIGKRMVQGWTLLDVSCPRAHCGMPLMSDNEGKGEICVLCGLVNKFTEGEHLKEIASKEETPQVVETKELETVEESLTAEQNSKEVSCESTEVYSKDVSMSTEECSKEVSNEEYYNTTLDGEQTVVTENHYISQDASSDQPHITVVEESNMSSLSTQTQLEGVELQRRAEGRRLESVVEQVGDDSAQMESQEVLLHIPAPKPEGQLSDRIRERVHKSQLEPVTLPARGDDPPAPNVSEKMRVPTDPEQEGLVVEDISVERAPPRLESRGKILEESSATQQEISTNILTRDDQLTRDEISISTDRIDEDVFTVSFPKDFDFADEQAFLRMMADKHRQLTSAQTGSGIPHVAAAVPRPPAVVAATTVIGTEESNGGEIIAADEAVTVESITRMFFSSPQGSSAKLLVESGNLDAVVDLAESFVRQNFSSETVIGMTRKELANELVDKLTTSTYREQAQNKPTSTYNETALAKHTHVAATTPRSIEPPSRAGTYAVDEIEKARSPVDTAAPYTGRSFDFTDSSSHLARLGFAELINPPSSEAQVKELIQPPSADVSLRELIQPPSMGVPVREDHPPFSRVPVHDFLKPTSTDKPHEDSESQASTRSRRPKITPESMATRGRSKKSRPKTINVATPTSAATQPARRAVGISPAPPARRAPSPGARVSRPRSMPPRPDNQSQRRTPESGRAHKPKALKGKRKAGIVVVGGPHAFTGAFAPDSDDISVGDVSRAETVATQTLDSLLSRIEECKATLLDPKVDVVKQAETARLIEQLASAAMAVKKLETLGA